MQDIGFKEGGAAISSGQVALLIIFLIALFALALYLRRKPQLVSFFKVKNTSCDVHVCSETIGPDVTWYKVTDNGKTYVFVNNGQQLLKLDVYQTKKDDKNV